MEERNRRLERLAGSESLSEGVQIMILIWGLHWVKLKLVGSLSTAYHIKEWLDVLNMYENNLLQDTVLSAHPYFTFGFLIWVLLGDSMGSRDFRATQLNSTELQPFGFNSSILTWVRCSFCEDVAREWCR